MTTFWLGKDDFSPVGLTGSQGALRLFAQLHQLIPSYSLVDIVPPAVSPQYFSPQTGVMYNEQCAGAVLLPAVVGGVGVGCP